jgi:hypothetical protein
MTDPEPSPKPAAQLRTMRIILVALCLGVLGFLAVALVVRSNQVNPPPPAVPLISYVGIAFAAGMLLLVWVVPAFFEAAWRRQIARGSWPVDSRTGGGPPPDEVSRWWALYQTRMLIRAAPVESAAFLNLIAYLVEGQAFSLGIAVGLLLVLVSQFPTREGVERWIDAQRDRVAQEPRE